MSLCPQPGSHVPEETARVARAAFPTGTPSWTLRAALATLYTESDFADVFPQRGPPAAATVGRVSAPRGALPCRVWPTWPPHGGRSGCPQHGMTGRGHVWHQTASRRRTVPGQAGHGTWARMAGHGGTGSRPRGGSIRRWTGGGAYGCSPRISQRTKGTGATPIPGPPRRMGCMLRLLPQPGTVNHVRPPGAGRQRTATCASERPHWLTPIATTPATPHDDQGTETRQHAPEQNHLLPAAPLLARGDGAPPSPHRQ
jgi:hypothetical protein